MLPIIILVMVSLLELGLAFRQFLTVSFTARDAARVGALAGDGIDADCDIVQTVVAGFGPASMDGVEIRIFKASEATGSPVGGLINTWELNPSGDPTTCLISDWTITENWPSTSRNVTVGPSSTLDILGVAIDTQHDWVTGFPPWRGSFNLTRVALQRLEPEAFE